MRLSKKPFLTLGAVTCSLWLSGCFGTDDSGPSAADIEAAKAATSEGTVALSDPLSKMVTGGFSYGNEDLSDLTEANASFEEALALDPNNSQANLGAALTGVLLGAQSPGLSSQVNNTLDAGSPFDPILAKKASSAKIAVLRKVAALAERPEFHEIQDSVAAILLPALEKAILRLQRVYNDPAFSLVITIDGAPREFDHAEAAVLLAGFKATHALATLILSYDIDIDHNGSYAYLDTLGNIEGDFETFSTAQKDSINVLTALLTPGSPFLAVKPAWAAKLAGVDDEIKSALTDVKEGLLSVKTETDDQSDDVLALCSESEGDCIDDADYEDGLAIIDSAAKYMNQPLKVKIGTTVVDVNVAAFFNVQDYKKMLPFYNFYPAATWDSLHPVIYFTNTASVTTGNLNTIADIMNNSALTTPAAQIAELKKVIFWQDPTFQGFLPGITTQAGVWNLIQQLADGGEPVLAKGSAASTLMSPTFALSLLGKD